MMHTSENYYMDTFANFSRCDMPDTAPDYVSNSGSTYWYCDDGVIRMSDHWGYGVASCDWLLEGVGYGYGMHMRPDLNARMGWSVDEAYHPQHRETEPVCGFCKWGSFQKK